MNDYTSYTGPRVNATVDIVVEWNDNLLLGRKPTDPIGQWRFIGGFSDPRDNSFMEAAWRELNEETSNYWNNCLQSKGFEPHSNGLLDHLCSVKIPDPRLIGAPDAIITTVFLMSWPEENEPQVTASDDLEQVKWFPFDDVAKLLVPWHLPIACELGLPT